MNIEQQYLALVNKIIDEGEIHDNRTGVNTRRLWVETLRHDMSEGFPLLTTKKMARKSCFTEMLGFIRGITDIRWYQEHGCNIWNSDHARWHGEDFTKDGNLESIIHRRENPYSLGRIYGAMWRNFNGFDQLAWIVDELRNKSNSRRLIMSAWNPSEFHMMCLPPCHVMYHFAVREGHYLDVSMTQRSCDTGLGVPFNIASTALLLEIMAHASNLVPGKLVWTGNDVHIYENQIEGLKEQCKRTTFPLSTLIINKEKGVDPWDVRPYDIEVQNYLSHPPISLPLSVG